MPRIIILLILLIITSGCGRRAGDSNDPSPSLEPDQDSDGSVSSLDCNDTDASIFPGATDLPYDGIDQDCSGQDLTDVDGDASAFPADCNDNDASIYPSAVEIPDDGIDQDCDGIDSTAWTCSTDWYGGAYCDCGCGLLDPTCDDANIDSCEYQNCSEGYYPDNDANGQCHLIECGNDQLEPGEECDDGALMDGDGCSADCQNEAPCEGTKIRIMAGNLTSGDNQSYDPGHGVRIFQGLMPDIVMIQEFNYEDNSTSDIRSFVDTAFGTNFAYYRDPSDGIPNGVISRWTLRSSGYWNDNQVSNRDFAWARINIPGDPDLWAVSVHFLSSSSSDRSAEATALVNYIKSNVPSADYLLIAGDLNTGGTSEQAIDTLEQVVSTAVTPLDNDGNRYTNEPRSQPYDWVLPDLDLEVHFVPVTIGSTQFDTGLVFDSRVYTPLSDVSPVQFSDSGAENMQHMGVVKDFLIPACE